MSPVLVALLAAGDVNVALLSEGCSTGFVTLVRDELTAAGLAVSTAGEASRELARVRLTCVEGALEVRIEDHLTDKSVERRVERASADPRADAKGALQVVELLHASLAEARYRSEPVPEQVETFLETKEPAPARRGWAALFGGAVVAPGGFGTQPSVFALLGDEVGPVELSGMVGATVHASKLRGPGGSAEVGLLDASVGLGLRLPLPLGTLHPRLGLGALAVWAAGRAEQGWVASAGFTATFAGSLAVFWELPVLRHLALVCGAGVSVSPAPVQVLFADSSGARIGLPLIIASVGLGPR